MIRQPSSLLRASPPWRCAGGSHRLPCVTQIHVLDVMQRVGCCGACRAARPLDVAGISVCFCFVQGALLLVLFIARYRKSVMLFVSPLHVCDRSLILVHTQITECNTVKCRNLVAARRASSRKAASDVHRNTAALPDVDETAPARNDGAGDRA